MIILKKLFNTIVFLSFVIGTNSTVAMDEAVFPDQPARNMSTLPSASTSWAVKPAPLLQNAICGNGVIEGNEQCDDGNDVGGDGCTNSCSIEESCYDPGNTFSFFTWSDSYGSAGEGGVVRLFNDVVNQATYPDRVIPRMWFSAGDIPYVPNINTDLDFLNEELSGANYPFSCTASNQEFPLFVALGNHDVDGEDTFEISAKMAYWSNHIGAKVENTLVGIQNFQWGPDNGYDARTTYSFDYKNTHFVVYNQYYGDPDYPAISPLACVQPTMYDWIDQDLANTNRPIKILVGHEPAWSYCSYEPGNNVCVNYGDNFVEDVLDPGHRPRPHSISGLAWWESYGKHWGDSLEDQRCPTLNGEEGRNAFWRMLARHGVMAHIVGHSHMYSSRLVDADGPRNDPLQSQAERNRMAYGKSGDIFTTADGIWEIDSGITHNSAGSVYVLVTVRDNRVSFEAWDQMQTDSDEHAPYRMIETWHVDVDGTTPPTDTTPPSAPRNLIANATSDTQIDLSWNAATDNISVTRYNIYRDGALLATATGTSYSDTNLTGNTNYSYSVSALDVAGNESERSASVSIEVEEQSQNIFLPMIY